MVVPGGLVCFFPSYEYEKKVHAHWSDTGTLEKIGKKKQVQRRASDLYRRRCVLTSVSCQVFREPTAASQVDQVLSSFAKCIQVGEGGESGGLFGTYEELGGRL